MPVPQAPSIGEKKAAGCAGKARYDDSRAARAVLGRMNDRRCGRSAHVYRCRYCAGWHIGHMKPRGHRGDRRERGRIFEEPET